MADGIITFVDGVAMFVTPDGKEYRWSDVQRYNNPGMEFDDITGDPVMVTPTIADTPTTVDDRSLASRVGNEDIASGRALALDPSVSLYSLMDPENRYSGTPIGLLNQALMRAPDLALGGLLAASGGAQKAAGYASDSLGLGLRPGDIPSSEEQGQLFDALYALPASRMLGAASEAGGRAAAGRAIVDRLNQPGPVPTLGSNFGNLPPAANAQRTQIAGTLPTYVKASGLLGTEGRGIDYGAGLGLGAERLGFDAFEPFPREGFVPTYTRAEDIPTEAYDLLTNLNVLNVMPRDLRDATVENIGRVLAPGGRGLITTRGRDVMSAQGRPGPEPMSMITSRDTYQKGFGQAELRDYLRYILGDQFDIDSVKLGPAGALIRKSSSSPRSASRRAAGPAEARGQQIIDMLTSGRAAEVTDDMLDLGDPVLNTRLNQYLFENYDLPMDEASRMARAGEMGFDTGTPLYHGGTSNFSAVSPFEGAAEAGQGGLFSTSSPRVANTYAQPRSMADASMGGHNVMPLYGRAGPYRQAGYTTPFPAEGTEAEMDAWMAGLERFNRRLDSGGAKPAYFKAQADAARSAGQPGAVIREVQDDRIDVGFATPSDVYITLDPTSIRSPFARFDPRLAHLRNLSAGVGGMGLLSLSQEDQ